MNRKFILKVREDPRNSHTERKFDYGRDLEGAESKRDEAILCGFWAEVIEVEVLDRSWLPAKR